MRYNMLESLQGRGVPRQYSDLVNGVEMSL